MLELAKNISPLPKAVKLPDLDYELPVGTIATVIAWGKTDPNKTVFSKLLQKGSIPLVDHQVCKMDYLSLFPVMNDMLCFGTELGQVGPCDGDFGGSATVNGTIYGIIAHGEGCGRKNRPTIFTKVSEYLKWIQTTCNNCIQI